MKHTIFIILLLLSVGCSSKTSPSPTSSAQTTVTQNDDIDEFDGEFEDENKEVFDPLEGYNRWMTSVNDNIYVYAFDPVSRGYAKVIPKPARVGLSNAFHNLKFPIRFANNLLQLKIDSSIKELGRFMVNSTVGLLGFIDVAKAEGVEPQDEDFGQTLGYYGVGPGFHIVLPFFGPSNLRDTVGLAVDTTISPTTNGSLAYQIPDNAEKSLGLSSLYYVNKNSLRLGQYESLKKDALDIYTFFRDSYEQKRAKEIEH